MKIGERIKHTRNMVGFSQTELAERCDISKQTLYKYENNIITNIPFDKIEKIAKHLEVSPTYLMGWTEKTMTNNERLLIFAKRFCRLSQEHQKIIMDMIDCFSSKEGVE